MSTLMVEELKATTLIQGIKFDYAKRFHIVGIYPNLLVYDQPAGTFTFTLKKSGTTVYSHSFTYSDVKNSIPTANTFVHVSYPIIPTNPVICDYGDYTLELSSSGYTFSESDYLGWLRNFQTYDFENKEGQINNLSNAMMVRFKVKEIV